MDMLKTELVRRTMTWEPANERPSIYDPANVTLEVDPYTYREHIRGQGKIKHAIYNRKTCLLLHLSRVGHAVAQTLSRIVLAAVVETSC